ncbi:MAG: response regulator [Robiginitomaculum sp.]
MSPDDIFAAQMWPWPDPLVKRGNAGHIIFVNAAFLTLYGGRVENWTGNLLPGWPAPSSQPAPYRFETRAGVAPSETVYDWVEVTMADGNAIAIARDVTVFQAAPAPMPLSPIDPVEPIMPAAAMALQTHNSAAPIMEQLTPAPVAVMPEFVAEPAAEVAIESAPEPVEVIVPVQTIPPAPEIIAEAPAPVQAIVETPAYVAPALDVKPEIVEPVAAQVAPAMPEIVIPEPAPAAETPRDFERRALPIENDESILGSNWRDEVIARAVGKDLPSMEAATPAAPEAVIAPQSDAPKQALRILLAEDNAINALLTRTLLEADGCTVETVEDGVLAVEAMKTGSYDLILMDMRMPNMDGLEATRKIRALRGPAENIPIIALTANAFDDDRSACFDSGMNDFMTKPVSAEELTAMVNSWINKSRDKAEVKLAV